MIVPSPQHLAADPRVNAFVMANAGSGKTTTLVNRVARLLLGGSSPSAILCLTFTKAAAAEMQRRLYQRLGGWAVAADDALRRELAKLEGRDANGYGHEDLARARRLFARALETPGGLKIQTIHAFCEQLLRRFPLEAGVSPSFRVIDDVEAASVVAIARDAVATAALQGTRPEIRDAYAAMSETQAHDQFEAMFARFEARRGDLAAYVERCGGAQGLRPAIAEALGLQDLEEPDVIELEAVSPPALDVAAWRRAADELGRSEGKMDRKRAADMLAVVEAASHGQPALDVVRRIFLTSDGDPRKSLAGKKVDQRTCEWLQQEQDRLCAAFDLARTNRVGVNTVHALTLAGIYEKAYEGAKEAVGALDFADLIVHARWLLTDGPGAAWVLYKLDGGVDHILIDEAQDTSPEQWDIARALTQEFFAGAGAREDGRERTVFVVGDEKQSIFSFQGAAPERLLAESAFYSRLIEAAGGAFESIPLHVSWRSTREVLALVDQVFGPQPLARALSPGRDSVPGDGGAVEHQAGRDDGPGTIDVWPEEKDDKAEERRAWNEPMDAGEGRGARRRLADRIVREIQGLVARGEAVHDKDTGAWRAASWGDVLVLVKTRGPMFDEVLRALKRSDVPVAGADRLRLAEHPVFEDLLALGRAALFPEDDLNLAGLLRSPLCDVDEDGLFALAHGRKGRLWQALRERTAERPEWAAAVDLVRGFGAESRAQPPFDLYARLLNRRDARGLTMRQRFMTRLGAEAADAMDAFLEQARAAEGRGVTDLERFCDALAALDQTVKREMDEPRGEVRVMTAHSAKGLEAPIVILPDTIFEAPQGSALLETAEGGFLWCSSGKNDCDASAAARALRRRRDEDESLRLLYVGLTRARDRLIIAGRLRSDRKIENIRAWWGPVADAFAALGDQVREVDTPSGKARRFGADPQRQPRFARAETTAPELPRWISETPRREAPARWSSPSSVAGGKVSAPSPLARQAGLGRFRRGDLVHKLLELLPDVPKAAREAAARRYLDRQPDLDAAQREEMLAAALAVLGDARFAAVFGAGSRAEVAVAGSTPELPGRRISGRVDRLLVEADRVLVVDFKSNRPSPNRPEDADPAYIEQMATYAAVLRAVFPGRRVEAALLWTDGPKLMPVPEPLLAAALARLRSG